MFFSFFKFLHNWEHIHKDALSKTILFLFIPGSKSCLHSWSSTFYAAGRNHSLVKEIQVSMNLLIRMPFKSTEKNISNIQLLVLPLEKAHKQPEEVLDFIYALLSSKIQRKKASNPLAISAHCHTELMTKADVRAEIPAILTLTTKGHSSCSRGARHCTTVTGSSEAHQPLFRRARHQIIHLRS